MSAADPTERDRAIAVWPPFVRAAIGLALTGGFGLGALMGGALALGWPIAGWWPAAVQAHGHAQLVGWAGLTVLGVGFHFLPRLRGAPLWRPGLARPVLGLIAGGVALRLVAQPLVPAGGVAAALLAVSGLAEFAGGAVAVAMLAGTWRRGPPLGQRAGLKPVVPFFAVGFGCLLGALLLNALGLVGAALAGQALVAGPLDAAAVALALEGFLVPVAVGMSMRLFPLYFRTALPRLPAVHAGLALWTVGLALRLAGQGAGAVCQALAVGLFVVGLGVFGRRVPLPRGRFRFFAPVHLHAVAAYGWLVAAALAQLAGAPDAARHALGAGFVTLLIFGVGAEMLPGFARRPLRDARLPWLTLALGSGAALLRVLPPLWPAPLPTAAAGGLYAAAGLCGLAALAAFAAAVPTSPR